MTTVTVFGGTGFLGRRLVQRLVTDGARVRVAVRHPEAARSALGAAGLEAVTVLRADVRDRASVAAAIAGADAAVNLSRHSFHGDWNYTISPSRKKSTRRKTID